MSNVRVTARAREDLLDIWLYVARQTSEQAADRIYDSIERVCAGLATYPLRGRARPEILPDVRSLVIERWLAIYRVSDDGPQILASLTARGILNVLIRSQHSASSVQTVLLRLPQHR